MADIRHILSRQRDRVGTAPAATLLDHARRGDRVAQLEPIDDVHAAHDAAEGFRALRRCRELLGHGFGMHDLGELVGEVEAAV